jgi:hypothetical protein
MKPVGRQTAGRSKRFASDDRYDAECVQTEINRWWSKTRQEADLDDDLQLDREEYAKLYERIVYAFNHDGDERTDLNVMEAKISLETDWTEDSWGDGYVDADDFADMVYELASTWAEDEDDNGKVSEPTLT